MDATQDRRAPLTPSQSRSCSELHKHLVSVPPCLWARTHALDRRLQPSEPLSPHFPDQEEAEQNKDCPSPQPTPFSPQEPPAPGELGSTTPIPQEDMQAVVQLISYMHTYCLPQRKLPPQVPKPAPQPCGSPLRQPRARPNPQHPSKSSWAEFSILRELLAQDLLCDVSKPYRLATPVYASLTPKSCSPKDSSASLDTPSHGDKVQMAATPQSAGPKPSLRPLRLNVRGWLSRPTRLCLNGEDEEDGDEEEENEEEEEEEWGGKRPARSLPWTKLGQRLDGGLCPVRRSRRLNPELGPWLSFTEETVGPKPQGAPSSFHLDPKAYNVDREMTSPVHKDSVQDQQLLQGPKIPTLESPCESGCGDTDEDPNCLQLPGRGSGRAGMPLLLSGSVTISIMRWLSVSQDHPPHPPFLNFHPPRARCHLRCHLARFQPSRVLHFHGEDQATNKQIKKEETVDQLNKVGGRVPLSQPKISNFIGPRLELL